MDPIDLSDRNEHQIVCADAGCVAQLLFGLGRSQCEDGDLAVVLLGDLNGLLDRAFLMGTGGEPEMGRVDGITVGGHVDSGSRSWNPLDADEYPHGGRYDFIRVSSASNTAPVEATVTGYRSFMYMTCRSVPGTASSRGR